MSTRIDIRQADTRVLQDQLSLTATTSMDSIVASINNELTAPGRLIAAATPSLVVTVGAGTVVNPNTSKNRTLPPISNVSPSFAGGTITFPSASGTITVSPGNSSPIVIGNSLYCAVLVQLDSSGNINLVVGSTAATLSAVVVPGGSSSMLSLGYIVVNTNSSGVIQVISDSALYQFVGGGGSGGGTGSGTGDDLDSLQFRASFSDAFSENSTSAVSSINSSGTNAAYSSSKNMWILSYDASKTATTSGATATMSAAPAFTVAIGDLIIAGGYARKITAVASQTSYTLEAAFPTALAATAVNVSQCVYTKDIYNFAVDGAALSSEFSGATFSEIQVDYKDNATSGSNLFTPGTGPFISFVGSNDNTNFTIVNTRPTLGTTQAQSTILPSSGTSLYVRFFANESSGSGTVNLITYKAFMQKSVTAAGTTGVTWSASGVTNGSTTPINSSVSVVGGKTQIAIVGYTYPLAVNSGQALGSLSVVVNGQTFGRLTTATPTGEGYYTEVSPTVIQLDKDYSSQQLEYIISYSVQVVDASTTNTTAIANNQEAQNQGFQGFVNTQSNLITATTTAGTPAAGSFYSSIIGRAALPDFTQDLKPRFGVERMMFQNIQQVQGEFGSNNELVWSTPNDVFGQIRFLGNWSNTQDGSGTRPIASVTGTDAIEVTFYGTGLNLLTLIDGSARSMTYSVDGNTAAAVGYPSSASAIITARSYASNQVLPIISGLTLGVHTVRIVSTSTTTSVTMNPFGIEILNVNSVPANVSVNPGVSYLAGQKIVNATQSLLAYNASVTGTTGGRVAAYISAAGTIGYAFTQNASSPSFLTAASHANEEVSRVYNYREFGSGRSDDFSTNASGSGTAKAFTLDDGVTSLAGVGGWSALTFGEAMTVSSTNGSGTTITFIGTGIDIVRVDNGNGGSDTYSYSIDGGTAQPLSTSGSTIVRQQKIASGLPYGTHTLTITQTSTASTYNLYLRQYIVYQPKTPAIPAGAVQIGSYNVMANYVANTTVGKYNLPTGALRKACTREVTYAGTGWSMTGIDGSTSSGFQANTATANNYFQYTFFGTGVEWRFFVGTGAANYTVSIDGSSNLSSYTTNLYASGFTLTPSTGVVSGTGSSLYNNGLSISGLTLGYHTIRVTYNSGTSLYLDCLDVITPVYAAKSNIYADLQNTLSVGSNSISDDRQTNPVKNLPATKAWAQAVGITSGPTTTSTTPTPCPDMSCVIKTSGGSIKMSYTIDVTNNAANGALFMQFYVDGIPVGNQKGLQVYTVNALLFMSDSFVAPVSAGTHKVDVYWSVNSGQTGTAAGVIRNLTVEEK